MSEVAAAKQRLRGQVLAARRGLDAAQLARARAAISELVLARARIERWTLVAAYEPLPTEPGSSQLLDGLGALGARVIVPILLEDNDLDWHDYTGGPALGPNALIRADAVLVPALAVSPRGHRLGRGGGSYDRALARLPAAAMTAAVLFDGEVLDEVPAQAWDVAVRAAVTPSGWRELDAE